MITIILLNLLFATFSILLLIKIGLKRRNQKILFSGMVFILFYLSVILYIYLIKPEKYFIFEGFPSGFFFGPFLYFTSKANSGQPNSKIAIKVHSYPFLVAIIFYVYFILNTDFRSSYSDLYFIVMFTLSALLTFLYGVWNFLFQIKKNTSYSKESFVLVMPSIVTSVLMMVLSIYTLIQIFQFSYEFHNNIVQILIVYFVFMLWSLILVFYVIYKRERTIYRINSIKENPLINIEKSDLKYSKTNIEIDTFNDYKSKIMHYLEGQPYLDPGFNLDTLSNTLKIYKHHCSYFFSIEYGVSFSKHIAQLRVDFACDILLRNNDITIEDLYMKCGFNSKASFYRSFKEFKNCTPKEFLIKMRQ